MCVWFNAEAQRFAQWREGLFKNIRAKARGAEFFGRCRVFSDWAHAKTRRREAPSPHTRDGSQKISAPSRLRVNQNQRDLSLSPFAIGVAPLQQPNVALP